ncbi:Omp28-related outer membrane protein [Brumimicrobium mesophilum]|uniref:Omp28-related outer membrane protein n=1 Tax=Brumimicrobium mesophilum TaxID=392717 RepID=UPI000D144DA1|nr:Omp28-related outer membrane protein [Brumimicrobium mesophilum]
MKHQILSTAVALFTATGLFAQLPVSQAAENKNAVLEEFTGIYCTFCPDGHKRAQEFKDANPSDVILVNVHAGGYAAPNGSDPDFRTPFGSAIASQSDLAGYPAGTINRRNFPGMEQQGSPSGATAMSRGDWSTAGGTVISEASYANIALEASIEVATRELTVDVEMYYTGTAPATNQLSVAILQSGIEGPQTGMAANPNQILANGNYEHNHMLRHLLTGQWGESITTATGTVITRQYVYTIPADLNGIAYELGDLEVVAFIAEGNQNIVTGAEAPITYVLPPGAILADLSATSSMAAPNGYCDGSVTPEITVTNEETTSIATYEVSYSVNGGTAVTQTVTNALAAGASATTSFPTITLPAGENTISYSTNVVNGSSYVELSTGNNVASSDGIYIIPSGTFGQTNSEGFESSDAFPNAPSVSNALIENPQGLAIHAISQANVNGLSHDLGGFGNSAKSLFWNFFSIASGDASLVFHKMDFSAGTDHGIMFNHAYSQYSTENDKLEILVSTDCGDTWTTVFSEEGSSLATAPATSTGNFFPDVTEWSSNFVDLSAYDGEAEVMVSFKGTSNFGNNLFVDDIQIRDNLFLGVEKQEGLNVALNVYPNPSTDLVNVDFKLENLTDVTVSILNTVGQTVSSNNLGSVSGVQSTQLDVSSLESGIYIVRVQTANGEQTKRISVIR